MSFIHDTQTTKKSMSTKLNLSYFPKFPNNSEADASELLGNFENVS